MDVEVAVDVIEEVAEVVEIDDKVTEIQEDPIPVSNIASNSNNMYCYIVSS
mgnify:FL=1